MSCSLRAVIFDFNGVIADDETPHFVTFQQALREEGLVMSKEDYYGTHMGMDERNCAIALLTSAAGACDPTRLKRILDRKARLFHERTAIEKPPLFPGVVEFVKLAGQRYALAIASGGRREQIDLALHETPIEHDFAVIVSTEDTATGKPDPEIYQVALRGLNATPSAGAPLVPQECLVIEDSKAGIQSARRAGMKVVAVATTYPPEQLIEADLVLPRLDEPCLSRLESLFEAKP